MVKKLLMIVALALLLCGSVRAEPNEPVEGLTVWGAATDNADKLMQLRVGWEFDRIEPGIALKWFTTSPDWGPQPDVIGAYMIYHVNEIVLIDDPEPDNPFEVILHSMKARPYAGIGLDIPTRGDNHEADLSYIVGTMFSNDPDFKWAFTIEYIEGEGAVTEESSRGVLIGARIRF